MALDTWLYSVPSDSNRTDARLRQQAGTICYVVAFLAVATVTAAWVRKRTGTAVSMVAVGSSVASVVRKRISTAVLAASGLIVSGWVKGHVSVQRVIDGILYSVPFASNPADAQLIDPTSLPTPFRYVVAVLLATATVTATWVRKRIRTAVFTSSASMTAIAFVTAGLGALKVWLDNSWLGKTAKVYLNTTWQEKPLRTWSGLEWK